MDKTRCDWAIKTEIEREYHDNEWGVASYDDNYLFEMLILEGMQAGLSWITILNKRENFREAFDNFDYHKIVNYNQEKIDQLLNNAGIIRNKLKVNATITNAEAFMKVQEEYGSFSNYLWNFVDNKQIVNRYNQISEVPTSNELSDLISRDLKKRGFKFVGTTIIYSYLQAVGVIDDHLIDCFKAR